MADDQSNNQSNNSEPQQTTSEPPKPTDMPQQQPNRVEDLPDWAQRELKNTREEAAKYRTRAREFADDDYYNRAKTAVEQLDKVENDAKSETQKLTEERERLLYESSNAQDELTRFRVAVKAGFSGDQAEDIAHRLQGQDEESLTADAQKLRDMIQPTAAPKPDHSQGAVSGSNSPGDLFAAEVDKRLR